ncbi:MAG: GNAT family N-acetyltransferase [Muribaculum sp.]|nr:GNAT family N-acetyltransferase [Muribaculum sp.]
MIRQGFMEDAAQMADIFNHYIQESTAIFSNRRRGAEDMRQMLEPVIGKYPFYVFEEDGIVLGYCFAHAFMPDSVYGRTWEITIYLRHGYTGRGIGSALLGAVVDDARHGNVHTLVSFITGGNTACENMHIKAGFERVGMIRQAGFKFGIYLDDVIYQLML